MRLVAQTIVKLRKLGQETASHKPLIDNLNTSSWRCDKILSTYCTRLESIYKKREKYQVEQEHIETVINNLNATSDSAKVYDELSLAVRKPLAPSALTILHQSINLMDQQYRRQISPSKIIPLLESQLFAWWRLVQESLPSFNKFKGTRRHWIFVTDKSDAAAESEYLAFLTNIFSLPFAYTSEVMVEKVKVLLADIIGIDSCSSDWNEAFSAYSDRRLIPFFQQLCDNTPEWITKDDVELKISDIIPFENQDSVDFKEIFSETKKHDSLRFMMRKAELRLRKQQTEIALEIEKAVLQRRDEALTQLIKLIKLREQALDVSTEEKEAYSACLRDMYDLRNKIEKELTDLANSISSSDKFPRLVEPKDIQEFLKLLNEYKETVNNFVYPYKQDRRVQEVNLNKPFPKIFELKLREAQLNISKTRPRELQVKLGKTIPDSQAGVKLLQDIREMSGTITPKARLANEISKVNPRSNILENLEEKLYELNDNELRVVSNSIAKLDTVIDSRDEILDVILAIVGLLPDRELATHRQYANRPINLEVTTVTEQSKSVEVEMIFNAPVTGATGKNDGIININISDQKKTLAEAANEIQQLLKQLEKTNPSATEPEQAAYIDASVQPNLKQRTIAALRSGGETAIDEFFLENKYLKVGKAVVKAWLQPTS